MLGRWIARALLVAFCGAVAWSVATARKTYDVVIRNGLVVDGTGNPGFYADIAIEGGSIVAIGPNLGPASKDVDAKGMVVAPGFIDVHTHAENIVSLPRAENFVRMGVTTVVIGNCGNSEESVGPFLSRLESKPVSVNVATLVGHNSVRKQAMGGSFDRPPTDIELDEIKSRTETAMRDGAIGLSTGLIYLPGTFAKTDEIVELAKIASRYGGIYASHMRNESTRIDAAIDELLAVAKGAKIRAELSHIKLGGEAMWGKADQILAKLEKARAEGVEITQDQYAYTASSTSLSVLIPDVYLEGGSEAFKRRVSTKGVREKIATEMKGFLDRRGGKDFAYAVIASCKSHKSLNGKTIVQAAREMTGKDDLESQIATIIDIQLAGGASAIFHGMHEDDVKTFMRHPNTMIASDAACRDPGEDMPHPRGYGNNARVLAKYARDQGILRLEDAIRKMTSLPAQTFRLKNRGLIAEGKPADIVVFDPKTINDPSTYANPHQFATGFRSVFVNGVETVKNDEHTGMRAGTPLRGPGFQPKIGK